MLAAVVLLGALALPARAAPRPRELKATGKWRTFEVRAPEEILPFLFEVTSGCRYRLTVRCLSLPRALVEVGPGEATVWRADSRPPDDVLGGEAEASAPPPKHPEAIVTWHAEQDGILEARVRGFSAMTGRGKLKLETLGPDGAPVKAHHRLLAPGGTLAQVGSIWVGEPNRWDLVVKPGRTYEATTRPGTAGRVRIAVRGSNDEVLGLAGPTPTQPYPRLRFEIPLAPAPPPALSGEAPAPVGKPVIWRLEVRAAGTGGGTYGVRLREDPPAPRPDAGGAPASGTPPPTSGLVEGKRLTFGANPGDVAFLYLRTSNPYNPHRIQLRTEAGWKALPHDPSATHGERASMRTPENAALVWFRPFAPGLYRFVERGATRPELRLFPAADVPDAPLLTGTGMDPTVNARAKGGWKTIAVGACMPGWDYLFVAVHRRRASVSLRVRDVYEDPDRLRTKRGLGGTRVAGMGPSLRFRVKAPTLVLLEVKGRSWEGYALLRRAGN